MNYRILALALGTFAVGTEGFMIAGLLPALAQNLNVSLSAAGQLVTVFSIAYALGSPILTTMTGLAERRQLLMWSLLLFSVGNFLCGLASTYWVLLLGRIITAAGAGLFAPSANYTAAALVDSDKRGRALSIVIGGSTVALIFGVPLGTWIASLHDWRMTFWIVGFVSMFAAVVIRIFFPIIDAPAVVSLKDRLSFLRHPLILSALLTSLTWGIGVFIVYTYVSDIFGRLGGTGQTISLMLFVAGIASFFGVNFGGFSADRFGSSRTIVLALVLLLIAVTSLSILHSLAFGFAAMALWGFSGYTFNPAQQHRLIGLSGKNAGIVLSLHNSFIYLGSALGSLIGGLVLKYGSATELGFVGGGSVFAALLIFGVSYRLAKGGSLQSEK
ncbi:MFS transporter [Paenibacillus hamazuiensis]|uniref:MFS transporter n=1 Tax=Paenibacillus hamazuiensis TaxID=2936508 RepID=UPI0020100026|nr:MFS transporter [Paenibacillus hamazuiensis]